MNKDQLIIQLKIGEGSSGETFRATLKDLETDICLKKIKISNSLHTDFDKTTLEIFQNEVRILKTLDHPNIVKYIGDYQDEDGYYILMELVEGVPLSTLIEGYMTRFRFKKRFCLKKKNCFKKRFCFKKKNCFKKRCSFKKRFCFKKKNCFKKRENIIPEETIRNIISQVTSALKYLSEQNIIHRNIKTKNIMYSSSGIVKIVGFGSSIRKRGNVIYDNSLIFNPYHSPELCGMNPYSNLTDVWSLGVVVYELMTSQLPIEGSDDQIFWKLSEISQIKKIYNSYSYELRNLINGMLCVDEENRASIEFVYDYFCFEKDVKENSFTFFLLGMKFLTGFEVEKDIQKAKENLKKSANLGYPLGMVIYGQRLEKGLFGIKSPQKAMKFYQNAAKLNNPNGMNNLGRRLEEDSHLYEAMEYYEMSADLGNSMGMFLFGLAWEKIGQDEEAKKYYKMSAD